MAVVQISVISSREGERHLQTLLTVEERTKKAARASWFELGKALKKGANREILRKPKSGRTYIIRARGNSGRRRRHVASAPGETHANMYGDLRKAIGWKVRGWDEMDFGYGVDGKPSPHYDEFVEFGTRRMDARPSLANEIDKIGSRRVEVDFAEEMSRIFDQ